MPLCRVTILLAVRLQSKVDQDLLDVEAPPVGRKVTQGLGLLAWILRSMGLLRERSRMEPVNLNKLVEPYFDSGLYLAVTKDNTSVVATGKTIQDAVDQAAAQGCAEPVIMRAPSRRAMENSLHL